MLIYDTIIVQLFNFATSLYILVEVMLTRRGQLVRVRGSEQTLHHFVANNNSLLLRYHPFWYELTIALWFQLELFVGVKSYLKYLYV